jgi:major membrane immunogen (membrane-anchored lipoprotein)
MKIAKHVFCATAVLAGLLLLGACSKSDADSDAGAKTQKYVIKLSATLDDGGNSSANGVSGATGAARCCRIVGR